MARHDQLTKFERLDSGERLSNKVAAVRLPASIQEALNRLEPLERAAFLRRVISEAVRAELLLPPPRPRRARKKNSDRRESDSAESAEKPQMPTQSAIQGADSEKTQTRRRRRTSTTG